MPSGVRMFKAFLDELNAIDDDLLGEDAAWTGVPVLVRVHDVAREQAAGFGPAETILSVRLIRVQRSAVAAPTEGDVVTLQASSEVLTVIAEPVLDGDGYWVCEVRA